jgi:hypothetical protein
MFRYGFSVFNSLYLFINSFTVCNVLVVRSRPVVVIRRKTKFFLFKKFLSHPQKQYTETSLELKMKQILF